MQISPLGIGRHCGAGPPQQGTTQTCVPVHIVPKQSKGIPLPSLELPLLSPSLPVSSLPTVSAPTEDDAEDDAEDELPTVLSPADAVAVCPIESPAVPSCTVVDMPVSSLDPSSPAHPIARTIATAAIHPPDSMRPDYPSDSSSANWWGAGPNEPAYRTPRVARPTSNIPPRQDVVAAVRVLLDSLDPGFYAEREMRYVR